jgi:hypothetical protein
MAYGYEYFGNLFGGNVGMSKAVKFENLFNKPSPKLELFVKIIFMNSFRLGKLTSRTGNMG